MIGRNLRHYCRTSLPCSDRRLLCCKQKTMDESSDIFQTESQSDPNDQIGRRLDGPSAVEVPSPSWRWAWWRAWWSQWSSTLCSSKEWQFECHTYFIFSWFKKKEFCQRIHSSIVLVLCQKRCLRDNGWRRLSAPNRWADRKTDNLIGLDDISNPTRDWYYLTFWLEVRLIWVTEESFNCCWVGFSERTTSRVPLNAFRLIMHCTWMWLGQ